MWGTERDGSRHTQLFCLLFRVKCNLDGKHCIAPGCDINQCDLLFPNHNTDSLHILMCGWCEKKPPRWSPNRIIKQLNLQWNHGIWWLPMTHWGIVAIEFSDRPSRRNNDHYWYLFVRFLIYGNNIAEIDRLQWRGIFAWYTEFDNDSMSFFVHNTSIKQTKECEYI